MISQTVEYSLRAMVSLANDHGQARTTQQISETTQVPGPYLSKVMQSLVKAGLVLSQRGRRGGFVLSKDPKELTIWEVVDAVEPFQRIRSCPLSISSHSTSLCPLHRRLDDSMAKVEESFRSTTLFELLNGPSGITPLCEAKSNLVSLDPGMDNPSDS